MLYMYSTLNFHILYHFEGCKRTKTGLLNLPPSLFLTDSKIQSIIQLTTESPRHTYAYGFE